MTPKVCWPTPRRSARRAWCSPYSTLSGLFKERYPHIKLAADLEKELAINRLIASENFLQTHSRLMKVAQFADFTQEQAEALIRAANRNTQIRWILGDDDVSDFYVELAGNYGDVVDPDEMAMF